VAGLSELFLTVCEWMAGAGVAAGAGVGALVSGGPRDRDLPKLSRKLVGKSSSDVVSCRDSHSTWKSQRFVCITNSYREFTVAECLTLTLVQQTSTWIHWATL